MVDGVDCTLATGYWPLLNGEWWMVDDIDCPLTTDHWLPATDHWPLTTDDHNVVATKTNFNIFLPFQACEIKR